MRSPLNVVEQLALRSWNLSSTEIAGTDGNILMARLAGLSGSLRLLPSGGPCLYRTVSLGGRVQTSKLQRSWQPVYVSLRGSVICVYLAVCLLKQL